jgi:hypothetical protein
MALTWLYPTIIFLNEGANYFRLTAQIADEVGLRHEKEFVSAFGS